MNGEPINPELKRTRRRNGSAVERGPADRLPPHDEGAEQGLLGAILLSPDNLREVEERFNGEKAFYDLRHQAIYEAMIGLRTLNRDIDMLTVQSRLKDTGNLDAIGGFGYLASLPDKAGTGGHMGSYLDIVWEKFLARWGINLSLDIGRRLWTQGAMTDPLMDEMQVDVERLQRMTERQKSICPPHLKTLVHFGEAFYNRFFGSEAEEPGIELPFHFPLKIRDSEMTFFLGEKGAGKSSVLSYILLHQAGEGQKIGIASMEQKPEVTLWIMASQLLGTKHLPDTTEGHKRFNDAYAWLNARVVIYDFLGIADWRDILYSFRYAAEKHGTRRFLIDSVMRLGIPDDDLAQQGLAAAHFAQFCMDTGGHLFLVNHLNKSDRQVKQRSRGSQQWIDNSHNVCSLERNEKKHEKFEKLKAEHANKELSDSEYQAELNKLRTDWDSNFHLHNQRWPGARQNGRRALYFRSDSLQLHEDPNTASVNWLERWKKKENHKEEEKP